ncbi:hypothetical protein J6590_093136 [Homalodisca vitripennis]|nr:hypothetical protein J6590_093136 [Homalodisca vitripennis]
METLRGDRIRHERLEEMTRHKAYPSLSFDVRLFLSYYKTVGRTTRSAYLVLAKTVGTYLADPRHERQYLHCTVHCR